MNNILRKEIKLSSSPLSYFFLLFSFMFLLPGYPILCSSFFVTLGIFQSFQNYRESNDIVFSILLPITRHDIVKGKFLFVSLLEFCSLFLMTICVLLRMTVFRDSFVYRENALMNANFVALSFAFIIFALFNLLFVCGYFKTTYKFARPFFTYIILAILIIFIAESLHYFPHLSFLNSFGFDYIRIQIILLALAILLYTLITIFSYKKACKYFEKVDL